MTDNYQEELISTRRYLHQYPEEGWTEFTTTAYLVEKLRGWGYEVLLGQKIINPDECLGRDMSLVQAGIERAKNYGVSQTLLDEMEELTGCVAILDTGRPGKSVGIRFDIDCIPVQESTDSDHFPAKNNFISKHPGFMHACGHDSHMSVGLAVAHWIMENKDSLSGRIKIVFQPAEEGVRGAAGVAASGILDDVDYFVGSHCAMSARSNEIIANLYGFLCTTKLDVTFTGKAAHAGACPQDGRNALAAACHATIQMLGISRHSDGMTRINVGQLIGGEGRNVIPSKATMKLEVRGETTAINDYMAQQVDAICKGVSISFGVSHEIRKMGEAADLTCDPEMMDLVEKATGEVEGLKFIKEATNFGGSEDATILARRVQAHGGKAVFFLWGSDRPSGHHSAKFDIVESDMLNAWKVWINIIKQLMA